MSKKNITLAQAVEMLKTLTGMDVAVVEEDKADKDLDLSEFTEEAEAHIVAQHKPGIEQNIKDEVSKTEKIINSKSLKAAVAKRFGISKKDMENMSMDEVLDKVKEASASSGQNGEAEWQKRLTDQEAEHELRVQELTKELDTERSRYTNREINEKLTAVIEALPRTGGKASLQAQQYRSYVEAKGYSYSVNETGDVVLMKDGRIALKGSKPLDQAELAKEWATDIGVLATDTKHVNPKDVHGKQPAHNNPSVNTNDSFAQYEAKIRG